MIFIELRKRIFNLRFDFLTALCSHLELRGSVWLVLVSEERSAVVVMVMQPKILP